MQRYSRIAVGIPVYNESLYVRNTVRVLKVLDNRHFIAFFFDNYSSDDSFEIIQREIGEDARFETIRRPRNVGALYNFEYLLKVVDAEYFMWLVAHDSRAPTLQGVKRICGIPTPFHIA